MHPARSCCGAVSFTLALALCPLTSGQTLGPDFVSSYSVVNQGSLPGVVAPYGGVVFKQGENNKLLIGGRANQFAADIFEVRFSRSADGRLRDFECGPAVAIADANGASGGIDGGLCYGPDGVLFYTTYSDNRLGQILPGGAGPARLIALTDLGIASSTGTLQFVPEGFPGAGRLKIASYNAGFWYDATVSPDGMGTFNVTVTPGLVNIGGGPEGIVYVAGGNPGFAVDSVLVSEYASGRVVTYEIDAIGNPIVATRRVFLSGLSGAEGAAIDPRTGDFVFSTFGGGDRLLRVTGFTETRPGDANCDGNVTVGDIGFFVTALTNPGAFQGCDILRCDVNLDGFVTVADIGPFVLALTSGPGCG